VRTLSVLGKRLCIVVSIAVATLPTAVARADSGKGTPSSPSSAAQQYVEVIPSGGGNLPSGGSGKNVKPPKPLKLSRSVARAIAAQAGSDAPALRALATSPELGAPVPSRARTRAGGAGGPDSAHLSGTATHTSTLGAAFGAARGVPAALAILALLTLGLANVIASRRNWQRDRRRSHLSA
jgi:hypothetical protein